ncbi:MAG: hypothetical protein H0W07_09480 [Chloroflexi bacterium]|nr:hypothetical protein [Chloroflexota bacterium]
MSQSEKRDAEPALPHAEPALSHAEPAMPDWAGDPRQLQVPLPDGRARVYYRWPVHIEGGSAPAPGALGTGPGSTDTGRHSEAPEHSEPWTPEAGPVDDV